jgi:hypothetical protein
MNRHTREKVARKLLRLAKNIMAGPVQLLPKELRRTFEISEQSRSYRSSWKDAFYKIMRGEMGFALLYDANNNLLGVIYENGSTFGGTPMKNLKTGTYKAFKNMWKYKQAKRAYQELLYETEDEGYPEGHAIVVEYDPVVADKRRERNVLKREYEEADIRNDNDYKKIINWQKYTRKNLHNVLMNNLSSVQEIASNPNVDKTQVEEFEGDILDKLRKLKNNNFYWSGIYDSLSNKYINPLYTLDANPFYKVKKWLDYESDGASSDRERVMRSMPKIKNYIQEVDSVLKDRVNELKPKRVKRLP